MDDNDRLAQISAKMSALLALEVKKYLGENSFKVEKGRRQGTSDLVNFLASFGLDAKEISQITGAPLTSVRTLLTPTRRK